MPQGWEGRVRKWGSVGLLTALFLLAMPMHADELQDLKDCTGHADYEQKVAACTRVAEDPGKSAEIRGVAYLLRGAWRHEKGDSAAANEDYSEAIKLNPTFGAAF